MTKQDKKAMMFGMVEQWQESGLNQVVVELLTEVSHGFLVAQK